MRVPVALAVRLPHRLLAVAARVLRRLDPELLARLPNPRLVEAQPEVISLMRAGVQRSRPLPDFADSSFGLIQPYERRGVHVNPDIAELGIEFIENETAERLLVAG